MSQIYDVCKAFYHAEKEAKSLTTYFMDFKKTYEELNVLLPFSTNIKVQEAQREKMVVMSTFSIQYINNVLVAKGRSNDTRRKLNIRGGSRTLDSHTNESNNIAILRNSARNYKIIIKEISLLMSLPPLVPLSRSSEKMIMVSTDDFAKFSQYQESLKISTLNTAPTKTGYSRLQKGYRCFSPDLNKYVVSIDVVFLEDFFFQSSTPNPESEGEDENLLIYQVIIPNTLTDSYGQPHDGMDVPPTPTRPPIVQVYSRHQETTDTCPAPIPLLSDPPCDLDLPIGLCKDKCQCVTEKWIGRNIVR
ncbi:hypothetical protein SADUNF_Sadunf11G0020900 [Salix dunnii]|uniref:Retroviral polymerase SH3-like domain-containing protein n=1 Tax=Salix dunnii TaxID=1413687 RepID=A0A835MNQ8_9ROSI|nr:hypothetical protein SADUNF_Sadunf11G0020900 [Salix dunnii]